MTPERKKSKRQREREAGRRQIARANQGKRQRQATGERKGCGYTNARFILTKGRWLRVPRLSSPRLKTLHGHVYTCFAHILARKSERVEGKERNMEKESVVNGCWQDSTMKFQLYFRIRGFVQTVELVKLILIAWCSLRITRIQFGRSRKSRVRVHRSCARILARWICTHGLIQIQEL